MAVILFSPNVTNAAVAGGISPDLQNNLAVTGAETGLGTTSPLIIVGNIIKVALGLLGAIAIVIIIYAGYLYMTAGGETDQIQKAKDWLKNGVIGLVIILAAYSIASFIISSILRANQGGLEIAGGLPDSGYGLSSGAFGDIIASHFPTPEQIGVPRNTMILVTFKKPINPSSILDASKRGAPDDPCPALLDANIICGALKPTIKLFRCADMPDFPAGQKVGNCLAVPVKDPTDPSKLVGDKTYVLMTEDHRTMVINPYGDSDTHLGSSTENVSYIVHLSTGITKEGGKTAVSIFPSAFSDGYKWRFTTSTLIDTTPPKIDSVVPVADAGIDAKVKDDSLCDVTLDVNCPVAKVYRNQMVIVNFTEPVIPPLIQTQACNIGDSTHESQLKLVDDSKTPPTDATPISPCTTSHVTGSWQVGLNSYKTIQFTSNLICEGVDLNSCGEKVFCLPKDSTERIKILAARMAGGISMFGTGIMDIAGNSLDGNGNGKANGPGADENTPVDNYISNFATGNAIDLVPPFIRNLSPVNGTENVDVNQPIGATFNKNLDSFTIGQNVSLVGEGFTNWFSAGFGTKEKLDADGKPVLGSDGKVLETADMRTALLTHGPFKYVGLDEVGDGPLYSPIIPSTVKDSRQNCFTPARADAEVVVSPAIPGAAISSVGGGDACSTANIGSAPSNYGTSCCANKDTYSMEKRVGTAVCELPDKITGKKGGTENPPPGDIPPGDIPPPDLPDLVVQTVVFSHVTGDGKNLMGNFTIKNIGVAKATAVGDGFKILVETLDKDGNTVEPSHILGVSENTIEIDGEASGNFAANLAGGLKVRLTVNTTDNQASHIVESDETNNVITVDIPAEFVIANPTAMADLAFSPGEEIIIPTSASPRIVRAMFTNLGSADTSNIPNGAKFIFLDATKVEVSVLQVDMNYVAAGGNKAAQVNLPNDPLIKFVRVILDANNIVSESNESNNSFERAVP